MKKIRKRLVALVLMAVMVFNLMPISVQAAKNKMKALDNYRTYTNLDITGDGKKDRFRFDFRTNEASTMYLNGKSQKILAYSSASLYLCNAGKEGIFLILAYGRGQCQVLTYKNGKFETIYDFGNFSWGEIFPVKYENNILYMKTIGYYKNRNQLSFTQAGKVDMYATYKFCLKKGKVKLASKYATVKDMSNIRIAMNSFTTSSTCNLKDKKGPKVASGNKVIVKKCYKGNRGYDDWRFLISVKGKTGWFKSSDKIQLY